MLLLLLTLLPVNFNILGLPIAPLPRRKHTENLKRATEPSKFLEVFGNPGALTNTIAAVVAKASSMYTLAFKLSDLFMYSCSLGHGGFLTVLGLKRRLPYNPDDDIPGRLFRHD